MQQVRDSRVIIYPLRFFKDSSLDSDFSDPEFFYVFFFISNFSNNELPTIRLSQSTTTCPSLFQSLVSWYQWPSRRSQCPWQGGTWCPWPSRKWHFLLFLSWRPSSNPSLWGRRSCGASSWDYFVFLLAWKDYYVDYSMVFDLDLWTLFCSAKDYCRLCLSQSCWHAHLTSTFTLTILPGSESRATRSTSCGRLALIAPTLI